MKVFEADTVWTHFIYKFSFNNSKLRLNRVHVSHSGIAGQGNCSFLINNLLITKLITGIWNKCRQGFSSIDNDIKFAQLVYGRWRKFESYSVSGSAFSFILCIWRMESCSQCPLNSEFIIQRFKSLFIKEARKQYTLFISIKLISLLKLIC